jgi:cell division protein FtsB
MPPGSLPPAPRSFVSLGRALERTLPIALLGLALVGAPIMIFQPEGLPRMRALEKELAEVQGENVELRRDVGQLRAEVKNLRDDPSAVERIARDQLGLVRKSEVVFQFTPSKK